MFNIIKINTRGYFNRLVREGYKFHKFLHLLNALDSENEEYRRDFQLAALNRILSHAYAKIPFWHSVLDQSGLNPGNLRSVDDLKKLPLLSKKEIQKDITSFLDPSTRKVFLSKGLTSGTTGSPGVFYRDFRSVNFENAITWSIRSKAGMHHKSRMVWLRGDIVAPPQKKVPPFWIVNKGENKLVVSTYHLIPEYQLNIIDQIRQYQPIGAFAYPSAAYILARWCKQLGQTMPFRNLHTSSETILEEQQEVIRSTLRGQWVDIYGQAERVNLLASFDDGDYNVYTEYGVTELLPHGDNRFEIIGSTLHNYAMPLFRYRTGDIVTSFSDGGNERPKIKGLSGRQEDFVRLPDNRLIGRLDLVFKGLHNIIEGQIYQKEIDNIIIRIVRDNGYLSEDEEKLMKNARLRLGHDVKISIQYADKIKRTHQNKFKFVVSDIK